MVVTESLMVKQQLWWKRWKVGRGRQQFPVFRDGADGTRASETSHGVEGTEQTAARPLRFPLLNSNHSVLRISHQNVFASKEFNN